MIQYLITDPKYYTSNPSTFKKVLTKAISTKKVDIACFRDKISTNTTELAKVFIDTCKKFNIETILINSNIELAQTINANGVHLTSTQFNKIQEAKEKGLFVIISCHTFEEIIQAQDNNVNMVTYSPIFTTPNKGEPKGCEELAQIIQQVKIPVIALGGILSDTQIAQIKQTKAQGFASIRYFINY